MLNSVILIVNSEELLIEGTPSHFHWSTETNKGAKLLIESH